jgi:hypothetical protein
LSGGPSQYNNNQGIKLTVLFTPIPVVDRTKRRRANAKAPLLSKITYFHEDFAMKDFLVKALILMKRDDLIMHSWLYQGHDLDEPNSFTASYTIPRCVIEQIAINEDRDFKQMVEEATKKGTAEVKLYIVEQKVCAATVTFQTLLTSFRTRMNQMKTQNMKRPLRPKRKRFASCFSSESVYPSWC